MVNDTEPRYRLVDPNGNVVGSLFAEADGTLKLQEGTSGNDNELSLTTQGALEVEQTLTDDLKTPNSAVPRRRTAEFNIADGETLNYVGGTETPDPRRGQGTLYLAVIGGNQAVVEMGAFSPNSIARGNNGGGFNLGLGNAGTINIAETSSGSFNNTIVVENLTGAGETISAEYQFLSNR